jgi:(p)ppGpp synthase/HD superfamily hydrolase
MKNYNEIIAENKGDIFADITKVIASEGLPIVAINARKDRKGNAVALVTVEISNHEQCNQLIQKIKSISAVINAYRTHG